MLKVDLTDRAADTIIHRTPIVFRLLIGLAAGASIGSIWSAIAILVFDVAAMPAIFAAIVLGIFVFFLFSGLPRAAALVYGGLCFVAGTYLLLFSTRFFL